jgi:hypothetical protein
MERKSEKYEVIEIDDYGQGAAEGTHQREDRTIVVEGFEAQKMIEDEIAMKQREERSKAFTRRTVACGASRHTSPLP